MTPLHTRQVDASTLEQTNSIAETIIREYAGENTSLAHYDQIKGVVSSADTICKSLYYSNIAVVSNDILYIISVSHIQGDAPHVTRYTNDPKAVHYAVKAQAGRAKGYEIASERRNQLLKEYGEKLHQIKKFLGKRGEQTFTYSLDGDVSTRYFTLSSTADYGEDYRMYFQKSKYYRKYASYEEIKSINLDNYHEWAVTDNAMTYRTLTLAKKQK